MKRLWLLILILVSSITTNAQDTTYYKLGYALEFPLVYITVDTIHNQSQVYNYYHNKRHFSINGGKAIVLKREQVMTVWNTTFTLTVTRYINPKRKRKIKKNVKHIYDI